MIIRIKTHPDSKKERIEELSPEKFEVWIKEKAENNFANNRLIEIIGKYFKIRNNQIKIISGHKKPNKIFEILN